MLEQAFREEEYESTILDSIRDGNINLMSYIITF